MNAVSGVECVMRDGVETYPGARIVVNQALPEGKTRISIQVRSVSRRDDYALHALWRREDEYDARYRAAETDEEREIVAQEMSEFYHSVIGEGEGFSVGSDDGLQHGLFSYATGETGFDEELGCPITYVEYVPARMNEDED